MSLVKNLHFIADKTRGILDAGELNLLSLTLTAIGNHSKNKLHEMAASSDLITNLILSKVKEFPISDSSKNLLVKKMQDIFLKTPLSLVIDIALNIEKLLEEYDPRQIIDEITSNLINLKTISILNVPDELIEIIKEYFDMPVDSTLHSGVIGLGNEITKLIGNRKDITFYGQDYIDEQIMLAEIQFMFSQINYEMKIGDILKEPLYIENNQLKQFDFVFNAPRFGFRLEDVTMNKMKEDPFNRFTYFGIPSRSNGDLGYVICGLQQLKNTGKGAFILPPGALTRSGADSKIRDRFLQADIIDVIIEFPSGLFGPVTGISTVLILFNKNKGPKAKDNIQFINASKFGDKDRMKTTLRKKEVMTIIDLIKKRVDMTGISKVLSSQQIEDTQLLPSKYVFDTEVELEDYGIVEIDLNALEKIDTVKLSEVAEIYRGYNALPKDQSEDGNFAVIKIADIEDGEINYDNLTRYQLGGRVKIDNYRLEKGDIILSIRGHALKVAVFELDRKDVLLSQNFVGIRLNEQYDPYFIKLYIESPTVRFILQSKLTGTTVMNLPIKEVKSLPIPKIPIEEQQRIVVSYREKSSEIKRQIKQLIKELISVKLKSFEAMGIGNTFTIKN